jgi:hypothetical protein
MTSDVDEQSFLRFVYSYVKGNPGVAVALQAYAREAIEERLREATAQIADTEAALVFELEKRGGRRKLKPESVEKLRKWEGRHAFKWDEMESRDKEKP